MVLNLDRVLGAKLHIRNLKNFNTLCIHCLFLLSSENITVFMRSLK